MPQPRGQKRIPGHALKLDHNRRAACECGWAPPIGTSAAMAMAWRGKHLVDVRMGAAEA